MRPQNKKHNFSRTDNKKYQEQNHKKEKTNNNNIVAIFYRIRVHYTVLTQHTTPTNNTQPTTAQVTRPQPARSCLHQRGDLLEQQPCCPRHPTACHNNKTNHQNPNTNTLILVSLIPPHTKRVRDLLSPENKNSVTNQALTSTHPVTKQI